MLRTGKINLTHIANDQLVKITLNFSKCKKTANRRHTWTPNAIDINGKQKCF